MFTGGRPRALLDLLFCLMRSQARRLWGREWKPSNDQLQALQFPQDSFLVLLNAARHEKNVL